VCRKADTDGRQETDTCQIIDAGLSKDSAVSPN
jgi:hypothetical protein